MALILWGKPMAVREIGQEKVLHVTATRSLKPHPSSDVLEAFKFGVEFPFFLVRGRVLPDGCHFLNVFMGKRDCPKAS